MKYAFLTACAAALLSSCGYHLNGVKPANMAAMNSFCVNMFDNGTSAPNVAVQMTTALSDFLQRDGTYRAASPSEADFTVEGRVKEIARSPWTMQYEDAYHSLEVGVTVYVDYMVRDNHTGKELTRGTASGQGSFFNDQGNVQSALDSALSYATRRAAEDIVNRLTNQ